jgi:hypothetical protein
MLLPGIVKVNERLTAPGGRFPIPHGFEFEFAFTGPWGSKLRRWQPSRNVAFGREAAVYGPSREQRVNLAKATRL